jgi:hypothetical protein
MIVKFTMNKPEPKKNSTRFNFEAVESILDQEGKEYPEAPFDTSRFDPSFYVPLPLARSAKRIRVTIEEL